MKYAEFTSGRCDMARLAEQRGGWLGLESTPDPRGPFPLERDRPAVPCPALPSDFDPGQR